MAVTRAFSSTAGGVINGPTAFSQSAPTSNFTTTIGNAANVTPLLQVLGLTSDEASALIARFSADATAPRLLFAKSRGATVNSLANMSAEDTMATISAAGVVGGSVREGVAINFVATLASGTYPSGSVRIFTSDGTGAPLERLRVAHTGALQMGTTPDTVISAARHFQLRSYTVATVPSAATATQLIWVSDGTGSNRVATSNGTVWQWLNTATTVS
ncbi:hypothetical protein [Inquilinus limosus]|uniref:Uncharacterized protein n=1 Tax=Inquilinus limosus TaxID=171674 RepID=A0A211ZQJ0_9PROT|nr:hypothetical protein [Inquilinus limosus]OWJ67454.1 hypothetical protein BWR60_09620 [Inquilinus limosus]